MRAAAAHAFDDFLVRHVDFDHVIDVNACLFHGFCLRDCAREPVEQKAILAVGLLDAFLDHADDDFIRHQAACVHELLGLQPQCRPRLDGSAQHVAGGNLRNIKFFLDVGGLGAFARAGGAQ